MQLNYQADNDPGTVGLPQLLQKATAARYRQVLQHFPMHLTDKWNNQMVLESAAGK